MDRDIRAALRSGELMVSDLDDEMVRPAAVSLRMGDEAYVLSSQTDVDALDPATYPKAMPRLVDNRGVVVLRPGEVMLARTRERIGLGERLAGLVDGTSDWARLGVSVVLAHQVSPGYGMPDGSPLTLEIVSRLSHDVLLRPGTRIANLMLLRGRRVRQSYRDMPANHSQPEWSFESRLGEAEALRSG
ncbi:dCTP deaminase [Pseudonocardia humida]|uniref:dCTP deaminase n=1 Tax=Pseudonocardia humida TaxID=2800819 RepID=UPI00207C375E|nr:2'-deoxycytidine 5'-triphosphate deaminase [Pseudonocardia humida]